MSHHNEEYSCPGKKSRMSQWRACLSCKIIKTVEEFEDGCVNCSNMSSYGSASNWTTPNFTGYVVLYPIFTIVESNVGVLKSFMLFNCKIT